MNKKYLLVAGIMLALIVSGNVNAEETSSLEVEAETKINVREPKQKIPPMQRPLIKKELRENKIEIRDEREESRKEIKDLRMENKDERKDLTIEEREENRTEVRLKRDELKKEMEKKRIELKNEQHQKMQVRFEAMVERLDKMADRIQSRIDKLKAEGKDTTKAETSLAEAIVLIGEVEIKADTIVIVNGNDEVAKEANKVAIDSIKAIMKQAESKLREAVKALK